MGNEFKARASYTLDPDVEEAIRSFSADMGVPTSSFVNYYFREIMNALETAKVETDYDKAKAVFANNKSVLYPGNNKVMWHLCIKLDFDV